MRNERIYFVKDSTGEILRVFYSYKDALSFKIMCNRHDFKIEEYDRPYHHTKTQQYPYR